MADLTLRLVKGSRLTNAEVDNNFTALNNELATLQPQRLVDLGMATKLWSYRMAGGEPVYSSPVGPATLKDGGGSPHQCVVLTSWDWHVYALKVSDGTMLWRHDTGDTCYGRCQFADINSDGFDEVFAPSHSGTISCIPSDGGMTLWQFQNLYDREGSGTSSAATSTTMTDASFTWAAGAFLRAQGLGFGASLRFTSGPAAGQSREIVGSPGGSTLTVDSAFSPAPSAGGGDSYVIDPKYTSDRIFMHAGTLVDESGTLYLYATGFDNHVYKLNATTGALVWKYACLENIEPYPLVVTVSGNRRCIVASIDGFTHCLDASTGAMVWKTATGQCDAFLHACDLDGDGDLDIIVSSRDGRVYALDALTGSVENVSTATRAWDYGDIDSAAVPAIMPGEITPRVFTGGDSGTAWSFDKDLDTMWARPLAPQAINSSPIFHDLRAVGSPSVMIGDMRGTLHCVDAKTGMPVGALYFKGGIEGLPYYGDLDGDSFAEIVVTTTDGYVDCYRLTQGAVHLTSYFPGSTVWAGSQ